MANALTVDALVTQDTVRRELAAMLRSVRNDEPDSGYDEMADDLLTGDLMDVPTWVVLDALEAAERRGYQAATERAVKCLDALEPQSRRWINRKQAIAAIRGTDHVE